MKNESRHAGFSRVSSTLIHRLKLLNDIPLHSFVDISLLAESQPVYA